MGKSINNRRAVQLLVMRSVVARYISGQDLEFCMSELKQATRHGPQSWAFKREGQKDSEEPEPIIYTSGGNV